MPDAGAGPRTLFDKIWDSHLVDQQEDGTCLIYIDRHLVHEVTSPQAFEGLRTAGRKARRRVTVMGHSGAGPDHPVALECPESEYLKAVWMRVE